MKTTVKFDSEEIKRFTGKQNRRALLRAGAYLRSVSRRSIRKKSRIAKRGSKKTGVKKGDRNTSKPGGPIVTYRNAKGLATPKYIMYAYDIRTKSVVVGMMPLKGSDPKVPNAWEDGGIVRRKGRRFYIRQRPTMRLALHDARTSAKVLSFFGGKGTHIS